MNIDLYSGETPLIYITLDDTDFFIPFKHGFKFYTKGSSTHWGFEGMDEQEFTPEMTEIKDWNWILLLDDGYKHATMISSLGETIHGNRLTIHTNKHYNNEFRSHAFETSVKLNDNMDYLYNQASEMVRRIQNFYPGRIRHTQNVSIIPYHRVSEYSLNCVEYVHS
jgi:hypothetical protein